MPGQLDLSAGPLVPRAPVPVLGITTTMSPAQIRAAQTFAQNRAYVTEGDNRYQTQLSPEEQTHFDAWVQQHKIPYDASATADYDMRGFWKALQSGDERARTAVDPNDNLTHYPDYWKTPYHQSFSNESQWANPTKAPHWNEKDQLVTPDGQVLYDDRAPKDER